MKGFEMPAEGVSGHINCDLLVIGSGAGGLSAAVTAAWHELKVVVAEKEPALGGTTACLSVDDCPRLGHGCSGC